MAKLLKITSDNGVDIVIIAVSDGYKKFAVIDDLVKREIAEFHGEIYIGAEIDVDDSFVDLDRPFVG